MRTPVLEDAKRFANGMSGGTSARDSWRAAKAFREHLLQELTRRCLIKSIKRAGGEL